MVQDITGEVIGEVFIDGRLTVQFGLDLDRDFFFGGFFSEGVLKIWSRIDLSIASFLIISWSVCC